MPRILCFGDSNTWGFRPDRPFRRYPQDVRWPGVLQNLLGERYEIIEEGLNGRTTVWDDPFAEHRNGSVYLPPCLESHAELDLVIIMLGINDLKAHFKNTAADVAQGLKKLVSIVRHSGTGCDGGSPDVLLVAPPPLGELSLLAGVYGDAPEKSKDLAKQVECMARFLECRFMDAGAVIVTSAIDGVHWEAVQHRRFAEAAAAEVRSILVG